MFSNMTSSISAIQSMNTSDHGNHNKTYLLNLYFSSAFNITLSPYYDCAPLVSKCSQYTITHFIVYRYRTFYPFLLTYQWLSNRPNSPTVVVVVFLFPCFFMYFVCYLFVFLFSCVFFCEI